MYWRVFFVLFFCATLARGADFVIALSVDAMGSSYLQALIDANQLPHFKQLEAEAAYTLNARNDSDITVTLPNHISMLTSRPVSGPAGHNWTQNTDPAEGQTLHSRRGAYVAGFFDVAHDAGRRTGLWATKTKFSLFRGSYDAEHGAPDTIGENNGPNKLDVFVYEKSSPALTRDFLALMNTNPCQASLLHFAEADSAGHSTGWGNENYNKALITLDTCLGQIMELIATNPTLKGKSTLIVTADHGGKGKNHSDPAEPLDYTIPFFVWGADVTPGDLYAWNKDTRQNPGTNRPAYTTPLQPIRNSEVGNLMLSLLNLGPIPGSAINSRQDLRITPSSPIQALRFTQLIGWGTGGEPPEKVISQAMEFGFTDIADWDQKIGYMRALAAEGQRCGVGIFSALSLNEIQGWKAAHPTEPPPLQVMNETENSALARIQKDPSTNKSHYQGGGEPYLPLEVLEDDLLCFHDPRVVDHFKARIQTILTVPGIKGVAFDFFGYRNYRCCRCKMSMALFESYRQVHSDLSAEQALNRFSLDTLVEVNNDLAYYVRHLNPKAQVITHVYPVFLSDPLYGKRLNVDVCGQTAAWFFEPYWTLEKIKRYSSIISRDAKRYFPAPEGAALLGYQRNGVQKSPDRVAQELQAILDGGCTRVQVCSLSEVVKTPELKPVFRKYFKGD
jgi:hypothetical protein